MRYRSNYAVLAGLSWQSTSCRGSTRSRNVGAGAATVLSNLQVLFVVILAWAVLHQRPDRRLQITLPIVLLGVVLVSGMIGRSGTALHPVAGVAYGLATSSRPCVPPKRPDKEEVGGS